MLKNKFFSIFLLVVTLGAVVRLFNLSSLPPSLNWDEISHGFNAYSILKTGSDEWGVLPVTNFRAYGDYPLPLNLYLTIPFIAVAGLSEFSIRFPHALLGIGTIISSFFLVWGITKNKYIALLTSLLVALEPWYVFTSRFVLQSNLSVFLLITALAAFFNRDKNKVLLSVAALFLGLTLFAYHTTRIFSPLLLVALIVVYRKDIMRFRKNKLASVIASILIIIFFGSLPIVLLNPESRARSNFVLLLDQGAVNSIEQSRLNSSYPPLITKLVYNRPVYLLSHAAKNYIDYFSPGFLFVGGGTQYQFSVPNHGLSYAVNLPFFYLGLLFVMSKALKKEKNYIFLLLWLMLSPLPASITQERFAVLRSSTMLPLPQLISILGLISVISYLSKANKQLGRVVIASYLLLLAILAGVYFDRYINDYSKEYSWSWQYGYKQAVEYVKTKYDYYDKILFTKKYGEPHEFVLFYWPWDPGKYKTDPELIRFNQSNWYWVDRFDKFYFVNDWDLPPDESKNPEIFRLESGNFVQCMYDLTGDKCLLITSPGKAPLNWKKLETINFLDGKAAFDIYEN